MDVLKFFIPGIFITAFFQNMFTCQEYSIYDIAVRHKDQIYVLINANPFTKQKTNLHTFVEYITLYVSTPTHICKNIQRTANTGPFNIRTKNVNALGY